MKPEERKQNLALWQQIAQLQEKVDLVLKATSVEYLLEQWITPDGKTITSKLQFCMAGFAGNTSPVTS